MFRVVIFRTRHVMMAMGLMVTFLGDASASPNTLTVQVPRPVTEAIEELENRYGWRITTKILHISTIAKLPMCQTLIGQGPRTQVEVLRMRDVS